MVCPDCNTELPDDSKFCSYCGSSLIIVKEAGYDRNNALLIAGLFYGINMLLCLLIKFIPGVQQLHYYLIFDIINSIITIAFVAFTFNNITHSLKWNNFSFKKLMMYSIIAVLSSLVVQFLIGLLNRSLFDEENYYYSTFSGTAFPILFMFLMIAVQPALIEELGYRGLIMSQLNRILDSKQVIFISAFVFALIHLNIFSMLWIIPFAVLLGYVREKENTIWYGVIIHFMFNATACIVEVYDLKLL